MLPDIGLSCQDHGHAAPAFCADSLLSRIQELYNRACDLEANHAAQRVEIARLHSRLQRLEDELCQGRGWLLHLADRLTSLEQLTQRLCTRFSALTSQHSARNAV